MIKKSASPLEHEPPFWLDNPRNVSLLAYAVYGVCALLLIADLITDDHAIFDVETNFGFYAVFGFAAYVALVVLSLGLRAVVTRSADYYDR